MRGQQTDGTGFDLERLGDWGATDTFEVTRERAIAYAAATNDPIADHTAGISAPPVFAVVPVTVLMADAAMSVVPDELMLRILHGEHDFRIHRPIEPGETLAVRARPIGIEGKASGVVVTVHVETRSIGRGDLVNEQYFVGFFRGGAFDGRRGEPSPPHAFDERLRTRAPDWTAAQTFDADQTFRYAEAAGDPMPIHLDDEFAKAMGLPGIIVHGLCTIAFVSHALLTRIGPDTPARLKRLAVRLSSPAQPGQTITTSAWSAGRGRYVFETRSDRGKFVIQDGLAEFAHAQEETT
ncbi:MaoC/PaaZ C-terminal domain-containing protein [Nocardia brasiliensis]|uniref:MaoC/PaaZ C-terminal domain-containing protein n=1 Tax=Nocardia brasiliensis TaxID=37326 RepID=UPI001893BF35|nr:MaoC/PaaZ C-terminal domain-containing protein [Nocardia brasiliensis]MBF6124936.1 MaoC family dehydratase N-terminal domain-containing protein [Nocardia brasiliensis]